MWGAVIEQVSKQWARMPDETMVLHGRRVYQVFQDIGYRASEALVAQNEKSFAIQCSGSLSNFLSRFGTNIAEGGTTVS